MSKEIQKKGSNQLAAYQESFVNALREEWLNKKKAIIDVQEWKEVEMEQIHPDDHRLETKDGKLDIIKKEGARIEKVIKRVPVIVQKEVEVSALEVANKDMTNEEIKRSVMNLASRISEKQMNVLLSKAKDGTLNLRQAEKVYLATPEILSDKCVVESWEESFVLEAPSLNAMIAYYGYEATQNVLFMLVKAFASSFGKRNDMTELHCKQATDYILNKHSRLTLSDVKCILSINTTAKKFNVDLASMKEMFQTGYEDKMSKAEEMNDMEHLLNKGSRHQAVQDRDKWQRGLAAFGNKLQQARDYANKHKK